MQTYRLRVAWREKHGLVRAPSRDDTLSAASLREAIGAVLADGDSLLGDGTNFAWLSDAEGNLVWTLRMDDQNADST